LGSAEKEMAESEISRFYTVLGHPLRRSIISIIGETGSASFTDLKEKLDVSVGTLYYNIDLMEGLVAQDESKRYVLSHKGKIAYRLLVESEEKLVSMGVEAQQRRGWFRFLVRALTLRGLFSSAYESPKLSLPSAVMILAYGMWITYQAQLYPLLFLYTEHLALPRYSSPLLFMGGWIAVNILGNLVPFILHNRPKDGLGCLLIGSCYSFLPSLVFPTIWALLKFLHIEVSLIAAQLFMLVSMGYSLSLLTTAVSVAKGLKTEKAVVVSMIILYLSVGLALYLLGSEF
jgi:hypothetical protein